MREFALMPIVSNQHHYITPLTLANEVRQWFQENGTLAFEHGFKPRTFIYKGKTYQPYMCNEGGVSVRNVQDKTIAKISWCLLPKKTILKILTECDRYYLYVRTSV